MRSTKATRWLSGTLAALLLAQGMCLLRVHGAGGGWGSWGDSSQTSQVETQEAKAEVQLQSNTAIIPSTATDAEIKDILFEKLVVNKEGLDAQALEWEFYGTSKSDPWLNSESRWVSVLKGGNWTSKHGLINYKYSVSPLKDLADGSYSVRLVDATGYVISEEVSLTKTAKGSSSITLIEDCSVALPHDKNGNVDYGQLREDIFEEVVDKTTPSMSVEDVTIQYQYDTTWPSNDPKWGELEGYAGGLAGVGKYDPISVGSRNILISYAGTVLIPPPLLRLP